MFDSIVLVPAIATELLITTAKRIRNEMQPINDPKKLACFAPFAYYSGSGIQGKTKLLIHIGTMLAIQVQGEPQDYYQ